MLVTSIMCYNLDLVQKMPKLNLTSLGCLAHLFFKHTFTPTAKKQLNVFFEGSFPLIIPGITSHLDI